MTKTTKKAKEDPKKEAKKGGKAVPTKEKGKAVPAKGKEDPKKAKK